MVIEAIHELKEMQSCQIQFADNHTVGGKMKPSPHGTPQNQVRSLAQDYFDALILRLVPGTDGWYRNHFPVILESNKSHYFNEKIYNELNLSELTFPTIEFGSAMTGNGTGP